MATRTEELRHPAVFETEPDPDKVSGCVLYSEEEPKVSDTFNLRVRSYYGLVYLEEGPFSDPTRMQFMGRVWRSGDLKDGTRRWGGENFKGSRIKTRNSREAAIFAVIFSSQEGRCV